MHKRLACSVEQWAEETYAKDQVMRSNFSQLILAREESVASHPGRYAAEMKEGGDDPSVESDRAIGWSTHGTAAAEDTARAESRIELSMNKGEEGKDTR